MATSKRPKSKVSRSSSKRRPTRVGQSAGSGEKIQANMIKNLPRLTLPKKYRKLLLGLIALAVLILGLQLWYNKVYADPHRVFWNMIDNNLSTRGFTKETSQPACVPNAQSTNVLQTTFTPSLRIRCITQIEQGIIKLTVESIGTTEADYVHYSNVKTTGENPKTDKYDKIYGMWLKNNGNESATASLYSHILNSPVLFGYFSGQQREKITDSLRKVYEVDYKKVDSQRSGVRETYVYDVTVPLRKFAAAEKLYAETMNLPIANQINPDAYPAEGKVKVKLSVDVLSRQLQGVEFQNVAEKYSGYGISPTINIPKQTVSLQQLQNAFQNVSR